MILWRIIRRAMLLVVCGITICGIAFCETPAQGLEVYFLDVGQGDATVILCDGEVMMVDGGPPSASQFIYSFLRNTLQIDHIDIMIATHPHADHVGGLAAALNACSVDVLYTSETNYDTKAWQSVLKYADAQGTPVIIPYPGDTFSVGEATVEILGPLWYHNSLNDLSLIVKVIYGNTSFLIMIACIYRHLKGHWNFSNWEKWLKDADGLLQSDSFVKSYERNTALEDGFCGFDYWETISKRSKVYQALAEKAEN